MPIIRRNNCVYVTLSGMQEHMLLHTRQSSTQNNKCCINTVVSTDDGNIVARNV